MIWNNCASGSPCTTYTAYLQKKMNAMLVCRGSDIFISGTDLLMSISESHSESKEALWLVSTKVPLNANTWPTQTDTLCSVSWCENLKPGCTGVTAVCAACLLILTHIQYFECPSLLYWDVINHRSNSPANQCLSNKTV